MYSNSLDSVILVTFIVNLLVATFIMVRKYFTNQHGMHIQMPYKYQLYLENGLTHSTISKIMCYHHLITGIWDIFLPFAIKYFGHRILIILASIFSFISSLIIGKSDSSINTFIIASCFSGLTMPMIMRCFQDIWQLKEKNLPSEWKANYVYNETRSLVSLITTWIISPLSSYIALHYGTRTIFNFSSVFILLSIIPTYLLINDVSQKVCI